MPPTSTFFAVLVTTSIVFTTAGAASSPYTLKDDLTYKNFFNSFDFFSGPDPTNGFVQYQTRDAAVKGNLVGYFNDTQSVFMGVDSSTINPNGRASVRLESKKTWNQGLLVADIKHMPDSTCGSWPAMWLLGTDGKGAGTWPDFGEIDILEGVNAETQNAVTLHTTANCAIDNTTKTANGADSNSQAAFLGSVATSNCDIKAKGQGDNVGCSIKASKNLKAVGGGSLATYGTEFNNANGGVYAMEWTTTGISVWFLPRNSSVTASLTSSSSNSTAPDPSTFGTPLARFQGTGCDYQQKFKDMKLIFNTAFCGEWAGKVWDESCAASTGVKTCQEYVQNNPEKFADAYWEVAGLRYYEKGISKTDEGFVGSEKVVPRRVRG